MKTAFNRVNLLFMVCAVTALLLSLAGVALAAESDEELAKKTQNPIASLISVPFQSNLDFDLGPDDNKNNFLLNIQPVIPVTLNDRYNLIIRTIVPIKSNEFPVNEAGLGDIVQSFFISPKEPINGWIAGAGPVMLYPSATDKTLGGGKWGAGPTAVVLKQQSGFTYGFLANHIWSFAGVSDRDDVNATFIQPFFSFTTKSYTTFGVNTESTYDWKGDRWTVPINATVTQLLKIGGLPLTLQLGYRYYAETPTSAGPDWGLRFQVAFLFPK